MSDQKLVNAKRFGWVLLLSTLGACTANDVTPPPGPPPPPPPPPVEQCSEATPICDPGCGAAEACVFDNGSCGCAAICNSTAPQCAGDGPNNGCGAGFFCDTSCACQAEIACIPDAPECEGNGPNNGCDAGFICNGSCECEAEVLPPENVLARPSRSTPIDINTDDSIVAMVNTDDGSVSFFNAEPGQESRLSRVASSNQIGASEPMSVVIHPDRKTAFVANRASGTVSRITNIDTAQPTLDAETDMGGEPIGLALNPTGSRLWVTNWVNGTASVIDTETMNELRSYDVGGNPWAIAITNDGDEENGDEKVFITQFYARPRAGAQQVEATDDGKEGLVQVISLSDPEDIREIPLAPIANCFESADLTSGCYPNQLKGITIHTGFGQTRAYVTSVAASPEGPVVFNHNVQAVVSVIDVETEAELPNLTTNLNSLVKLQPDTDGDDNIGRRFLSVPNAIDFVNRGDVVIGYVTAAGSDIMVRVEYTEAGEVTLGAPTAFNIVVGQNPQGLVVKHSTVGAGAYTANLISRDMSIVSFRDQRTSGAVESTAVPNDPRSDEFKIWRGKRFFNTGTGIWSKEGWGSCQGCHPMGLTDNVTFKFAAGPRQTISLDGQYASNDPSDMRALNWTAIFDETTDFELNTRGVSGGVGALQNDDGRIQSPAGPPFASLTMEDGETVENHQALNGSLTFIARNALVCTNENTCPDWDLIDAYIQSVRSPRAKTAEANQVALGRTIFEDAGCDKCHAGPKWTVSRNFYTPEDFSGDLPNRLFETNRNVDVPMDPSTLIGLPLDVNLDATLIAGDDSDGGAPALKRQACNIRNVGTFGAPGGSDETRANTQPAQGRNGFNPPSLLGLSTGAPYLHNGAAVSLEDLLDARFAAHSRAGNPNFTPTADERAALAAFLLSIDESTTPFSIVDGTLLCPQP